MANTIAAGKLAYLILALAAATSLPAGAFEVRDLPMMQKRLAFYQQGQCAIGVPLALAEPQPQATTTHRPIAITVYYVTKKRYDPLWDKAQQLRMPIVFHTEAEGTGSSHSRCAAVARRFPRLPVQLPNGVFHLVTVPNACMRRPCILQSQEVVVVRDQHPPFRIREGRLLLVRSANQINFGRSCDADTPPT